MKSDELMLKIKNVSKIYRLGEIGGTTLRDELQRLKAKILRKEDPTKKIGTKNYNKGEKFKALDNISFEVKKGERIGIIGHNGAGKSTLLKLISRVTGPTYGKIYLNGRVASMLEVGTGFHPELTGRENVYMNGAILGMTKKEIDAKMENIIEFSEVRQFIDTPVKRYSSGMYVKLAFSVAAHLDSEIMIMDEVLAVGDVAFQNKCLTKMKKVSEEDNRTILYVSHNMSTIRRLCNRVIVLDHGTIIFDGNVDEGINKYIGTKAAQLHYIYDQNAHSLWKRDGISLTQLSIVDKKMPSFRIGELIRGVIEVDSNKEYQNVRIRFEISTIDGRKVATTFSNNFDLLAAKQKVAFAIQTEHFVPGEYLFDMVLYEYDKNGRQAGIDGVYPGMVVTIEDSLNEFTNINWRSDDWGYIHLPDFMIENKKQI